MCSSSSQGKYGKWIRTHHAVLQIDGTLFLHGGISPKLADGSVRQINERVRAELQDFSKLEGGLVQDSNGRSWVAGLAQGEEPLLEAHVRKVLAAYQVERIAIGHTYTDGAVASRFGGKVLVIDVGLSRFYDPQGRMACLVLEKGAPFALHRGKRVELPADSGADQKRYLQETGALDREARSR